MQPKSIIVSIADHPALLTVGLKSLIAKCTVFASKDIVGHHVKIVSSISMIDQKDNKTFDISMLPLASKSDIYDIEYAISQTITILMENSLDLYGHTGLKEIAFSSEDIKAVSKLIPKYPTIICHWDKSVIKKIDKNLIVKKVQKMVLFIYGIELIIDEYHIDSTTTEDNIVKMIITIESYKALKALT